MEVLFFLYVCPQVGKSNIALFALRFTFDNIGGDTFEAIKEEQFQSRRFCCFYKCVLWLCLQGMIFWTPLRRFVICICVFSGCAFGRIWYCFVCIWIFIWSHRGGDTFKTVQEEQYADHSSVEVLLFLMSVLRLCFWINLILPCLHLDYICSRRFFSICVPTHSDSGHI